MRRAGISPALVGAADASLLARCDKDSVAAIGVRPDLDVWSYQRKARTAEQIFDLKSDWKYYRHHKSSFLEVRPPPRATPQTHVASGGSPSTGLVLPSPLANDPC